MKGELKHNPKCPASDEYNGTAGPICICDYLEQKAQEKLHPKPYKCCPHSMQDWYIDKERIDFLNDNKIDVLYIDCNAKPWSVGSGSAWVNKRNIRDAIDAAIQLRRANDA
jgi:hypothetical protein